MAESGTDDALLQAQYVDLQTWLPGDILVKVDRASMANSLEVRAPFLDHELVAWGLGLPAALKLRGGRGQVHAEAGAGTAGCRARCCTAPSRVSPRPWPGCSAREAARVRAPPAGGRDGRLRVVRRFRGRAPVGTSTRRGRFDHSAALWLLLVFEGFLAGEAAA